MTKFCPARSIHFTILSLIIGSTYCIWDNLIQKLAEQADFNQLNAESCKMNKATTGLLFTKLIQGNVLKALSVSYSKHLRIPGVHPEQGQPWLC